MEHIENSEREWVSEWGECCLDCSVRWLCIHVLFFGRRVPMLKPKYNTFLLAIRSPLYLTTISCQVTLSPSTEWPNCDRNIRWRRKMPHCSWIYIFFLLLLIILRLFLSRRHWFEHHLQAPAGRKLFLKGKEEGTGQFPPPPPKKKKLFCLP